MPVSFSRRTGSVAAIIGVALGAVYLGIVAFQQVDGYLFPGNELTVPAIPAASFRFTPPAGVRVVDQKALTGGR